MVPELWRWGANDFLVGALRWGGALFWGRGKVWRFLRAPPLWPRLDVDENGVTEYFKKVQIYSSFESQAFS